jgi:cellulose synthase/poly-beta-1,6-N-acetylglucosamine synthase-like glycosyltransferase
MAHLYKRRNHVVAAVPAHNEEDDIARTIESLLNQTRAINEIIVICDNCTDRTVEIAHTMAAVNPTLTILETENNSHRKSGALNQAWHHGADRADILICCDGDTQLPDHAVADWEAEFDKRPDLGGSSSQPIMTGSGFLPRLQRFEFSKSATMSLSRGWCRVVSGTGCAYRGEALREAARIAGQHGPWTYESVVEDYHLTYQLRRLGWHCGMSPTVYCYTGSMTTLRALWHQRIKWQAGTCGDLLRFGCNRLNYREWLQQGFLLLNIAFWAVWLSLNGAQAFNGGIRVNWLWQALAVFFALMELSHVRRMREYDWKDVLLAVTLVQMTVYSVLCMAWGTVSWFKVLRAKMGDLWAPQYKAEGMADVHEMNVGI